MEENKRISDLFERARTEAPKTSFDDVKGHFLATSAVAGAGLLAKWAAASFKFKAIVMISALSTLTISGVIIASQFTSTGEDPIMKAAPINTSEEQNLEVTHENGVQKTIVYDNQDQVVEVIVDSSGNLDLLLDESEKESPQNSKDESLSTKELTPLESFEPEIDTRFSESQPPSDNERRFTITENTTVDELNEIQDLAEAAGIKMEFTARVKRNVIKRISMKWVLKRDGNNSNWNMSISGSDDFSVEIGWLEDENGKAIEFLNDKRTTSGSYVNVKSGSAGTKVEVQN